METNLSSRLPFASGRATLVQNRPFLLLQGFHAMSSGTNLKALKLDSLVNSTDMHDSYMT